ncbi:hypothetical protein Y032_0075g928 [Ancylostoma ceylanicum]|uniref:Tc1-like transposase DDE domain-containing protein n=1 Tax=Ancylostoma ceylanicum TaxID=53326 RepID=A0A016TV39_9BILA|nr:hypothetical protein Y032_0075g928 [Ancylostoma ceylanicum]
MSPPNPDRAASLSLGKNGHSVSEIARLLKLHRETVRRTLKRGTLEDLPRSGRPVSVATPRLKKLVAQRIKRDAARSMRKMATEMNVSERTMRRVVREQLSMFPYKYQKKQGLTEAQKKARREKCLGLLARTARGEHFSTLFSDEKLFTVERCINRQNSRVLAHNPEEAREAGSTVTRNLHAASVMVWAGVSATGRTPLVFVEDGVKINADVYVDKILKKHVLPWSLAHYRQGQWTFQQDGAPAHRAVKTQEWCRSHLRDFISAKEWPANSPDLNVMDYAVWGILEGKACAKPSTTVEALKNSLKKACKEIPQKTLRAAIESYPKRLKAVIEAKGGHIE